LVQIALEHYVEERQKIGLIREYRKKRKYERDYEAKI